MLRIFNLTFLVAKKGTKHLRGSLFIILLIGSSQQPKKITRNKILGSLFNT